MAEVVTGGGVSVNELPFAQDRTRAWRELREAGEVVVSGQEVFLTSAAAVEFAAKAPETFSSARAFDRLGSPVPIIPIAIGIMGTGLPRRSKALADEKVSGAFAANSTAAAEVRKTSCPETTTSPASRSSRQARVRSCANGSSLTLTPPPVTTSAMNQVPSPLTQGVDSGLSFRTSIAGVNVCVNGADAVRRVGWQDHG